MTYTFDRQIMEMCDNRILKFTLACGAFGLLHYIWSTCPSPVHDFNDTMYHFSQKNSYLNLRLKLRAHYNDEGSRLLQEKRSSIHWDIHNFVYQKFTIE